jgi:hypothetical protein
VAVAAVLDLGVVMVHLAVRVVQDQVIQEMLEQEHQVKVMLVMLPHRALEMLAVAVVLAVLQLVMHQFHLTAAQEV